MRLSCGQCGYLCDAPEPRGVQEEPAGLVCPRCGHVIPPPLAEEPTQAEEVAQAADGEPIAAELGEEEGFADLARRTSARTVTVACGRCGKSLKVSARLAGKTRRCPACKTKIRIPYPDDEEDLAHLSERLAEKGAGLDLSRRPAASLLTGTEEIVTASLFVGEAPEGLPAAPVPAPGLVQAAAGASGLAEFPESLPTAAELAASAPATLDLDVDGPRRTVTIVAVAVLGVALLAVVGVLSHRWIIRREPAEAPPLTSRTQPRLADANTAAPSTSSALDANPSPSPGPVAVASARDANLVPAPGPATTRRTTIFDIGTEPAVPTRPIPPTAPVPPVPVPPPPTPQPLRVAQTTSDLFLADGYAPVPLGHVYWKVAATVTAGPQPLRLRPFDRGAVLVWPEGNAPCRGLLEGGAWPAQRLARRDIPLAAGQSATVTLLFQVPQALPGASLRIAGLPEAAVRPAPSPAAPGGPLQAGTYVERPPRNLRPLLSDPVMAALQSQATLELRVSPQAEGFALLLPGAGASGTATPAGPGAYTARLQKGAAVLDCFLRTAAGGKTVVLYLQDAPFHQITFALRTGAGAP